MTGVALVILKAAVAVQSQVPVLTMDEAVSIAERNTFAVRLQQTTVEKDRQAMLLALAGLGATGGFSILFTQNGQETSVSFGSGSPPVVISPFNTTTGSVSINLPLDISGNLNRLWAAGKDQYEGSRQSLEASFNDARLNARSAYLTVLRNQSLVTVAEDTLNDAKGRLDQAKLEFQQQQIARIDMERFDAQVAQSTSDLLNAQNNLELSKYALNTVLARPIMTPLQLQDVGELPTIPTDPTMIDKTAQVSRPESRSLQDQIKALALIRRAQEQGLNPSLNLGLGHNQNITTTLLNSQASSIALTATLNVPVFDSGATRARVREARQDETTAKITLEQTQLGISQEIRGAFANLQSAQARLVNADRQVKLAQEVFRLAKVRQDAGEGTYVEVIDAENTLVQARDGYVSAKYDYFTAYSQLQHGTGNDNVNLPALGAPPLAPRGNR